MFCNCARHGSGLLPVPEVNGVSLGEGGEGGLSKDRDNMDKDEEGRAYRGDEEGSA